MGNQRKLFSEEETKMLTELTLKTAEEIANEVKRKIEGLCDRIEVVGSIRRRKAEVHDIDFVILTPSDSEWYKIIDKLKDAKATIRSSGNAIIKTLYPHEKNYVKVDFYRAKASTFGILKLIRTGSADHNMWLASYAISKGMRLKYSQGLLKGKDVVAGETEEEVFTVLELPYPKPQEREVVDGKPLWLA